MTIDGDLEEVTVGLEWDVKYDDRDLLLLKLNEAIDWVHHKSLYGRVSKNDKTRVQWFKTLAYMISIYNQVKKDSDLDDLKFQVQELAEQIKKDKGG